MFKDFDKKSPLYLINITKIALRVPSRRSLNLFFLGLNKKKYI
jgi:hypothetical protein